MHSNLFWGISICAGEERATIYQKWRHGSTGAFSPPRRLGSELFSIPQCNPGVLCPYAWSGHPASMSRLSWFLHLLWPRSHCVTLSCWCICPQQECGSTLTLAQGLAQSGEQSGWSPSFSGELRVSLRETPLSHKMSHWALRGVVLTTAWAPGPINSVITLSERRRRPGWSGESNSHRMNGFIEKEGMGGQSGREDSPGVGGRGLQGHWAALSQPLGTQGSWACDSTDGGWGPSPS